MAEVSLGRVVKALEGPAYVAVGFGVLGYQRAQVYRRSLQQRLSRRRRPEPTAPAEPPPAPRPFAPASPRPSRQSAADVAGEAVEALGPVIYGVASLAADRLRPMVSDAAERVGPLVSEAAEKVAPVVADVAERVRPFVSEAAERLAPEANEFLRATADLVNDIPEEAKGLAREAVAIGRYAFQALISPPDRGSEQEG